MGFRKIFWIDEAPIRGFLETHELDARVYQDIGRQVLAVARNTDNIHRISSRPFMDGNPTFFGGESLESHEIAVFLWTGERLLHIPASALTVEKFTALSDLQMETGFSHIVTPMTQQERRLVKKAELNWVDPIEKAGKFSLYSICNDALQYHPVLRDNAETYQDVGETITELMFSNWFGSKAGSRFDIRRACTFTACEMSVLVWHKNDLKPLTDLGADQIRDIILWLKQVPGRGGMPAIGLGGWG